MLGVVVKLIRVEEEVAMAVLLNKLSAVKLWVRTVLFTKVQYVWLATDNVVALMDALQFGRNGNDI
jgi:hypothetical protein